MVYTLFWKRSGSKAEAITRGIHQKYEKLEATILGELEGEGQVTLPLNLQI